MPRNKYSNLTIGTFAAVIGTTFLNKSFCFNTSVSCFITCTALLNCGGGSSSWFLKVKHRSIFRDNKNELSYILWSSSISYTWVHIYVFPLTEFSGLMIFWVINCQKIGVFFRKILGWWLKNPGFISFFYAYKDYLTTKELRFLSLVHIRSAKSKSISRRAKQF